MDSDVRELLHDAAPEPSSPLDANRLWVQGRRQRRTRRVFAVLAAIVVVAGAAVGLRQITASDVQPEIVGQPEVDTPSGWQTLQIGGAAFAVPGDWPVARIGGPDGPMPCLDRLAAGDHRVYLADSLHVPSCPAAPTSRDEQQGQVTVYAYPAAAMSSADRAAIVEDGQRLELPRTTALMDDAGTYRTYLFEDAGAVLLVTRRWDPQLADQILATVRPAGQTQQPGPAVATDGSQDAAQSDCDGQPAPDYDDVPEGWSALPPPPRPWTEPATVWTGDRLLTFGGRGDFGATASRSVFAFEPAEATWTCGRSAPFDIVSPHAAWDGDRAYVWGPRRLAAYDPAADTWQDLPLPPDVAYDPFTVTWTGDELLVWGSDRRGASTRQGAAFDPETGTWRELPDAPIAINQGQAIWTGTELIVYGSQLDGNNRATTRTAVGAAYDPQADTWRELPPFELSPQATSIVWSGQVMVAFDYELAAGMYDPQADSWTDLPDLPLEFAECYPDSATLSDGQVFAWYCGQAALLDGATWTQIPTPVGQATSSDGTVDQISGSPIALETRVYLVGATHEGQDNTLWSWTATE